MLHKTLLGLTGLTLLTGAVVAPWLLHTAGSPVALAADGRDVLLREIVARDTELRAPAAPQARDLGALREPVVTALQAVPERAVRAPRPQAELTPDEQKQVNKLDKKLAKTQSKAEKLETKQANLADDLAAAQLALDAAGDLPESTEKEIKAKAKLLAKWQKKLLKLQAKLDKGEAKLEDLVATLDDLGVQITVLDPEHFADVPGLQAPEQMSVVTADGAPGGGGGGGSGFLGGGSFLLGGNDFPLLSDFNTDPQHHFVYDPSMKTLGTVNMILCLLSHTAYDQMVNAGTYVAQIDESLCEAGDDNSSSGSSTGQSSGGNAAAPALWVVKSTRPTEDGSQTVKFWVPSEGDDGGGEGSVGTPGNIRVLMDVTRGISDNDPFGAFNLNFAEVPVGGELKDATSFGNLRTLDVLEGFIGFSFFETEGDLNKPVFLPGEHAQVTQANVNMFDDQSQGVARIRRQSRSNEGEQGDTGVQTEEYLLAFNDQTVLRQKDSDEPVCLSRTDFDESVFRYGLYEAQGENLGARVARNGGFGFKTASGQYGWIGYYGMWAPPDVTIDNGDVVTKSVFGGGPATPYTVLSAPGKLIRNTRQQLALEDADGAEFTWWDFPAFAPPPGEGGGDPPPGEGGGGDPPPGGGDPPGGGGEPQGGGQMPAQYRVTYDHESGEFRKVASFDNSSGQFSPLETPEAIDIEAKGNFLQMYSESLGGQVSYVNGEESLTYFTRQFVSGSDAFFEGSDDVTLLGFQNCLKAGISGEEATLGQVFLDPANDVAMPHRFVFRKSDLTLYFDADGSGENLVPVGLAEGEAPSGGPFTWGMNSGPMLTSTEGLMNTYEAFNQEVFFSYETGHNSWNKYQSLVDAEGQSVFFDPPLQFTYTHSLENDRNGDGTWAGKKFLLEYNGPGDMHGIPGQPVDLDGDGNPDRYLPVFSIADGALCGPTGTEYVIKALDVEQSLQLSGPGGCNSQTVGPVATLPLPDLSAYTAPAIGPKPYITDAPAVIDGEVVDS